MPSSMVANSPMGPLEMRLLQHKKLNFSFYFIEI